APLEHVVDEDLGAVEDAVEVDGEDLAPGRVVHLHKRLVAVDPGVVDEDVDVAEGSQNVLCHPEGVGEVAHVGSHREGAPAALLDLGDDGSGGRLARHVVHGDVGALIRQGEGDRSADPAGGPGHHRLASLELHHGPPGRVV